MAPGDRGRRRGGRSGQDEGQIAAGMPFVGYLVGDGVEVTFLDDVSRQIHLPLSATANDLCVSSHTVYVAGDGGYLTLRVNDHGVGNPAGPAGA